VLQVPKVLFVFVDPPLSVSAYRGSYHGGLASLSASLKKAGHSTSLLHLTQQPSEIDRDAFVLRVREHDPDLVAFTATSNVYAVVAKLASWLANAELGIPTICGGIHATFDPRGVLEGSRLDAVCVGEGDQALVDVCDRMGSGQNLDGIPNIWVKTGGGITGSPIRPLVQDLDGLPFPDRDLFDYPELELEARGIARVMFSRGCPYSCTYCCNNAYRKVYEGQGEYVRLRSVDSVLAELEDIKEKWDSITEYLFDDDVLFCRKKWLRAFAAAYPTRIGLPFSCNLRPNMIDAEVVELLRTSNCTLVRIGLESGDPRVRQDLLNRHLSDGDILRAAELLHGAGISVSTFNMVGLPGETPRGALSTVKLNARARTDYVQASIFQPYRGTRLYDVCREDGMLSESELTTDYFTDTTLTLKDMSRSQVRMFRRHLARLARVYRLVYRLPPGISRKVEGALDAVLAFPPTAAASEILLRPVDRVRHGLNALLRWIR
jgi:anaerobic magnesium-protoporphyrin IX monomethyl ester cyclase